jgi:uncharacterized protein (TIGR03437 family)
MLRAFLPSLLLLGSVATAQQYVFSTVAGGAMPPAPASATSGPIRSTQQRGGRFRGDAGQAAAVNVADGSINDAVHPVKIGRYIALFATGEGQTTPAGVDGKLATGTVLPQPMQKVRVTVDGIPAVVQYAGAAPGAVAGLMQVSVQIPAGVHPDGYVPVVLTVGDASTVAGAVWIAVAGS